MYFLIICSILLACFVYFIFKEIKDITKCELPIDKDLYFNIKDLETLNIPEKDKIIKKLEENKSINVDLSYINKYERKTPQMDELSQIIMHHSEEQCKWYFTYGEAINIGLEATHVSKLYKKLPENIREQAKVHYAFHDGKLEIGITHDDIVEFQPYLEQAEKELSMDADYMDVVSFYKDKYLKKIRSYDRLLDHMRNNKKMYGYHLMYYVFMMILELIIPTSQCYVYKLTGFCKPEWL